MPAMQANQPMKRIKLDAIHRTDLKRENRSSTPSPLLREASSQSWKAILG
jgi:hypothetical protein